MHRLTLNLRHFNLVITYGSASVILYLANVQCVQFQSGSLDWLVGLSFLFEWIEVEALLHLFSRSMKLQSGEIFTDVFYCQRMIE
jgi:hypothetical protein